MLVASILTRRKSISKLLAVTLGSFTSREKIGFVLHGSKVKAAS